MLNCVEHFTGERIKTVPLKADVSYAMKMYGGGARPMENVNVKSEDIALPNYSSIFSANQ